ncbi:putative protein kinase [Rosellinia necatrix]|uniref:non-specific serine/threonine protein kinase n=1 Tax=Rosellinia necatrix TaxID=77044 RepID=A0A1W2TV52_ROSNE|nr:putative protein kinase [Rosellinia necatrix]
MADTDLIACVYPYKDLAFGYARKAIEDSPRYMPPRHPRQVPQETHQIRGARESTEPPENPGDDDNPDTLPYIELRFSAGPRTSSGFVFGKDSDTSDIVLPTIAHISRRHFALTYKNKFADGCHRLIVRDLGSTGGTIVTYDDGGSKLRRSKFDWIIDGFDVLDRTKMFIIQPHESLKFQVIVNRHDISSPTYVDNVERFRRGVAGAEDLFGVLDIQTGPVTERHSRVHTPVKNPILLPQGWIAQGGFGAVSRHWDVSTGQEYARKQPIGKTYNRKTWEKEIDIMRSISHEHIIRLCFWNKAPLLMYLEYMPFGNLEDEHKRAHFSQDECLVIFQQSLSALAYLHGRSEPVAHRDLKPENILVQYRDADKNPNYLHVRLSDFGLSKTGSLKTMCGSETYCPPEIGNKHTLEKYTKAVDIWSLGVVVLRYAYSLPYPGSGFGMEWCEKIVEEAGSWDSEGLINILQRMLVIDAKARPSAADCLCEASRLVISSQDRSATPTPASYAAGYRATIRHVPREGQGGEEQETLRIPPYSETSTSCAATLIYNPYKEQEVTTQGISQVWQNEPPGNSPNTMPGESVFVRSGAPSRSFSTGSEHTSAFADNASIAESSSGDQYGLGQTYVVEQDQAQAVTDGFINEADQQQRMEDVGLTEALADCHGTNPSPPEPPKSHLSTRSVKHSRGGLVYVVIRRRRVSMRLSDHYVNISEVMTAARLSKSDRDKHVRKLRNRTVVSKQSGLLWAPFEDSIFLCRELQLEEDMKELLAYGPEAPSNEEINLPRKRRLPKAYQILEWNRIQIAYVLSMRIVNATHLLKLGEINRGKLAAFFSHYPQIWKSMRRGPGSVQGTYIKLNDAPTLCHYFGLSQDPINQLLSIPRKSNHEGASEDKALCDNESSHGIAANGNGVTELDPRNNLANNDNQPEAVDGISGVNVENSAYSGFDAASVPRSFHNDPPLQTEDARTIEADHRSLYTERSYTNGSYLAPPNRSFEQLRPR